MFVRCKHKINGHRVSEFLIITAKSYCASSFFTETAISLILLTARLVAERNALMMVWGWSPSST